ncbi:hypothetical protein U1Q18_026486 [Sarracenia purpurea var. burkii]
MKQEIDSLTNKRSAAQRNHGSGGGDIVGRRRFVLRIWLRRVAAFSVTQGERRVAAVTEMVTMVEALAVESGDGGV